MLTLQENRSGSLHDLDLTIYGHGGQAVSEEKIFEDYGGDDGRTPDHGYIL